MGVDEICTVAHRSGMVVLWDGRALSVGKRKDSPPETPAPPVEVPAVTRGESDPHAEPACTCGGNRRGTRQRKHTGFCAVSLAETDSTIETLRRLTEKKSDADASLPASESAPPPEKPASIPPPEPRPQRETASDRMRRLQAGRR